MNINTMNNFCSYCRKEVKNDNYLECDECEEYVHIKCLKRPGTPGDFAGDTFFNFKCCECTLNNVEMFERQQLPWTMILVIVLYNLSIQSKGLSHNGYFHWKSHIGYFIEKNWTVLFPPTKPRMKNFIGTISGALFTHNKFFESGNTVLGEQGWWKLVENKPPKHFYKLLQEIARSNKKKQQKSVELESTPTESDVDVEEYIEEAKKIKLENFEGECSRTKPYMGRKTHVRPPPIKVEESHTEDDISSCTTSIAANLTDFLSSELSSDTILEDISVNNFLPLIPHSESFSISDIFDNAFNFDENNSSLLDASIDSTTGMNIKNEDENIPRIVQITNYQEIDDESEANRHLSMIKQEAEDYQSSTESEEIPCEKSLFTVCPKREYPWLADSPKKKTLDDTSDNENIALMKEADENELFKRLHFVITNEEKLKADVPTWVRRFYRKLSVRRKTRLDLNSKLLDIDSFSRNTNQMKNINNVLDRFHHILCEGSSGKSDSFQARLAGTCTYELFESPYTGRILHPFIYRNNQCKPLHIKLMCELQLKVNDELPSRSSIDFCYVRPQHIAGVNSLLQMMFWPGIDMSECLSYPDFSVVALYKKLIVGCAFLIPDVGHNEAYVSFLAVRNGWERAGIGKFMLYHLTQTCMGKDITLHVSATNSAICLYQKFGFKIEEVVLDFYDKYLPPDSPYSHHAFFLRLTR